VAVGVRCVGWRLVDGPVDWSCPELAGGGGFYAAALVACLRDFPADDRVRLRVRQADGQEVELALTPARACEELVDRLRAVVGEQGMVASELVTPATASRF